MARKSSKQKKCFDILSAPENRVVFYTKLWKRLSFERYKRQLLRGRAKSYRVLTERFLVGRESFLTDRIGFCVQTELGLVNF